MDKLTTRDMDYLFMDRNTSYLAEPFEIMKGIKPYSVDEHFGDIRKSIIIKRFEKMKLATLPFILIWH